MYARFSSSWRHFVKTIASASALSMLAMLTALPIATPPALAAPADPNAPAEYPEVSVTRNAGSPLTLQANLSKNVYRYVEREITETVQVPYTVTVPYTDYETYTDYERRCDWYSVPQCHLENVCRDVTRYRDVCQRVEVCRQTPQGRRCHWENRCRRVPYTDRECSTQNVCRPQQVWDCRTFPVTRTRAVTRYRTETRYRSEQQTRIITIPIFERQYGAQVLVHFPAGSELQTGELETLHLTLEGSESRPDASLNVDSSIFSYRILSQRTEGRTIHFELQMVSKYTAEMVGPRSVEKIRILPRDAVGSESSRYDVSFVDRGRYPRVSTEYQITVVDQESGETVDSFRTQATSRAGEVVIPMPGTLTIAHDHRVTLEVRRQGLPLAGPVSFSKDQVVMGQIDTAPFADRNSVRQFEVTGINERAQLSFTDSSPRTAIVNSRYEVTVLHRRLGFLWKHEVAKLTLTQSQLTSLPGQRLSVSLADAEGVSDSDLKRYFDAGDNLFVEVAVIRESERFGENKRVEFTKEAKIKVRK